MNRLWLRRHLVVSVASACLLTAHAQQKTERPAVDEWVSSKAETPVVAVPLDAPLDDASYVVGPGDQFIVTIATVPPQVLPLFVTAEGTLVIPLVGEVAANGKSLAAFRTDVLGAIKRRYLQGEPTVTLVTPRKILIRVRGTGVNEGTYVASASDRVQSLLARTDIRRSTIRPDAVVRELDRDLVPVLRRSIRILRAGREPIVADLERYEATRDPKWSPYLQEGDEVIFSSSTPGSGTVSVGGGVVLPGTFEWRSGDRVRDLLSFAKGLDEHAVPESVQVVRASGSVDWHTSDSESEVGPGDRIVVLRRTSPSNDGLVAIEGEVRHPGRYPVTASRTRLSEIIQMAGGLTSEAMVHATSVYRRAPAGDEQRLLLLTADRGNAALEDTAYVRMETQARLYGERVSANAARAIAEPSSDENVLLQPGDRIVVPRRTGTVYVFGQVRRPGHQPFKPGGTLSDYLARAGGTTDRAKDDEVSVIKYASRQWLSPDDATIEEGDMIWVPRVVERDIAYKLSVIGQIAGIVSATATLILLVTQVGK